MSRLTRHDIVKEDKFVETFEKCRDFFLARQRQILMIAGIAVLVALIAGGIYFYLDYSRATAREDLARALTIFEAPVGNVPAGDGGPSFKSSREKNEKALAEFQKVLNHGESSTTSKISKYYIGLCLKELNRDTEAIAMLEPLTKEKSDYGALAMQVLAGMYEKNGNQAKAVEALQLIISYDQPAAPKSASLMHLAQLFEQQNKNSEAIKTYQQLIKEYPESSLVQKAEERLKLISK